MAWPKTHPNYKPASGIPARDPGKRAGGPAKGAGWGGPAKGPGTGGPAKYPRPRGADGRVIGKPKATTAPR